MNDGVEIECTKKSVLKALEGKIVESCVMFINAMFPEKSDPAADNEENDQTGAVYELTKMLTDKLNSIFGLGITFPSDFFLLFKICLLI